MIRLHGHYRVFILKLFGGWDTAMRPTEAVRGTRRTSHCGSVGYGGCMAVAAAGTAVIMLTPNSCCTRTALDAALSV